MSGPHRAGQSIEDLCRACKELRDHRVIAVDAAGVILRVICGYCGSQHNYRGGGRAPERRRADEGRSRVGEPGAEISLVSEAERVFEPVDWEGDEMDIEQILRRVIREECGLTPVPVAEKWRGGELVLKPGRPGVQEKTVPIETFFHKIVMLRNRLRVLEQKVNSSKLAEDEKLELQSYITGCYGSLTTFNVLFSQEEDKFKGASEG